MKSNRKSYSTQWAGQFFVSAELTRRGYCIAFTMGNAPVTDIIVTSPAGMSFRVEVKSQASKRFWLVRRHELKKDHFYIFAFVPKSGLPEYFIMTCADVCDARQKYAEKMTPGGKYRDNLGGFNWTTPHPYRDKWHSLPN